MKSKLISLLLIIIACLPAKLNAQTPNLFNYQAVARNANGEPITNKTIKVRISIRHSVPAGNILYSETRSLTTNEFGLFNVIIGSAGGNQTGSLPAINWNDGNKYLQTEIALNNDNNFVDLGTTALVSVPYALQSSSTEKIQGQPVDLSGNKYHGYVIKWDAVNNKWVAGKDEDGGFDLYFKATKNSLEGYKYLTVPLNYIWILATYEFTPYLEKIAATLHFKHEEADAYGVFNDSVFTCPTSGIYEFELVMRFSSVHTNAQEGDPNGKTVMPDKTWTWLGMVKNGTEVLTYTFEYYENGLKDAHVRPIRLHKAIYLQAGDKLKFKFAHNNPSPVVLGYSKSQGHWYDPTNWECLYIVGRKTR